MPNTKNAKAHTKPNDEHMCGYGKALRARITDPDSGRGRKEKGIENPWLDGKRGAGVKDRCNFDQEERELEARRGEV